MECKLSVTSSILEPCREKKRRTNVYRYHTFGDPGCPINLSGSFQSNIRTLLRDCANVEEHKLNGMSSWCILLVDEKTGVVIPLYVIEENVKKSKRPFCDHCRCNGWTQHFVSKRRYHFIIPPDEEWDKHLCMEIIDINNHLLHGLIHCNGFGHLLCINGREGGSKFLRGREIMDLWDRICNLLRAREITLEDTSKKRSMDLRLLYSVAYGRPWFGRWNYRFCRGSFGITESKYENALKVLTSLELDKIITDFRSVGGEKEIKRIVSFYRNMAEIQLVTIHDLLHFVLDMKTRTRMTNSTNPSLIPRKPKPSSEKCRNFSSVAIDLASRWSSKRLEFAANVIVDALKLNSASGGSGMTRQEVRDAARLHIGDTGLLDFVIKSIGDCLVGDVIVRRTINPSTRTLEFSLDPTMNPITNPLNPSTSSVYNDITYLYRNILENYPTEAISPRLAARTLLDCRHFVKIWPFVDDMDGMFRFVCWFSPSKEEKKDLESPPLPPEVVVVPLHSTIGELKAEAEKRWRGTYCIMEGVTVDEVEGIVASEEEPLLGLVESGGNLWFKGRGIDLVSNLRCEGGGDTWIVDCTCGAKDDDGERMVACDVCEVWQHTRCGGIDDSEPVPQMYLCGRCGTMLVSNNNSLMWGDYMSDF